MKDPLTIPEDEGTHSLFRQPIRVGPHQAILDIWTWEGVRGWSFIFNADEVSLLSDETLLSILKDTMASELTQGNPMIKRGATHLFINFASEKSERTRTFDPVDRRTPEQRASARMATCEYLKEHNARELDRAKHASSQSSLF